MLTRYRLTNSDIDAMPDPTWKVIDEERGAARRAIRSRENESSTGLRVVLRNVVSPWVAGFGLAALIGLLAFMAVGCGPEPLEPDYGCATLSTNGLDHGPFIIHFGPLVNGGGLLTRCVCMDGRLLPTDAKWRVTLEKEP